MSEPNKEPTPTAKAATEAVAFTDRLQKAFDEAIEIKIKAMELKFDKMIEDKLATLEVEAEHVLRKGLGVDKDRPIMLSEIQGVMEKTMRKAQLEVSEPQKKTPAAIEKAGPEGTKSSNPIDKLFEQYGVN